MFKLVRIIIIGMICLLTLTLLLIVMGVIKSDGNIERNSSVDAKVIITTDGNIGVGIGDENFGVTTNGEYGVSM